MKLITAFLLLCFSLTGLQAQNYENYLKSKDFEGISRYFDSELDVQLSRDKLRVSKAKAVQMLKENLNSFKPVKYETMHQGASGGDGANYVIIKLTNAQNESVRLFLHMEGTGATKKIVSIRIRSLS